MPASAASGSSRLPATASTPALRPKRCASSTGSGAATADDRPAAFEKLLEALDTDLAWARAHTRLLVRAVEWDARRDGSLLLRGRDLEGAVRVIAENAGKQPAPTDLQKEYLLASRHASARRQRIILGSVSFALLVSVSLGIVALLQRNSANNRARIARSQALAAQAVGALDTAPVTALRDAVEAMNTKRTPEARVALRGAILANPVAYAIPASAPADQSHPADGDALAFSPDGRALLGITPDHALHVWRSASGRAVRASTTAATFAQRGRLVLSGGNREARVVDLRSGASRVLRVPKGLRVVGVGFTGSVPRAAVAGRGAVELKDVRTGRAVRLGSRRLRATQALFSGDGRRVVTLAVSLYSDSPARVWDARSGRLLATLPIADKTAVSRDGRFVATVYGSAALWRVDDRTRVADLGEAEGVFFSPDGRRVLAVGQQRQRRPLESVDREPDRRLPGLRKPRYRHRGVEPFHARRRVQPRRAPAGARRRRRDRPSLGGRDAQAGRRHRDRLGERARVRSARKRTRGADLERGRRGRAFAREHSAPHGLWAVQ
jgi:hypothetical protein